MNNQVLRVDASMRHGDSTSRKLTDKLINRLLDKQPIEVTTRDLAEGVPLINESWIAANFTDPASRSFEHQRALAYSDKLVAELKASEIVVIGLPIYNFHVPAAFKAWIDMVARVGETFRYTDKGPVGLLEGKTAYVILTSGGTKLGTEIDFVSDYIVHVLGFIGITDVTLIDSSGLGKHASEIVASAEQSINRLAS